MALITHSSEFFKLFVKFPGSDVSRRVPGVGGYREIDAQAPERYDASFEGMAKRTGQFRIPSLEMSATYLPIHDIWRKLTQFAVGNKLLHFRVETKGDLVRDEVANETVEILAGGEGHTLFSSPLPNFDRFAAGMVLTLNSVNYVIDEVEPENSRVILRTLEGDFPVAVVAGQYSVKVPALFRGFFPATIRLINGVNLQEEGNLFTDLSLSPRAHLPEWQILDN